MDSGLKHEYGIDAKQAPTVTYVNTSTLIYKGVTHTPIDMKILTINLLQPLS